MDEQSVQSPFLLLSDGVRSWVNRKGWARLRPIQEQSLPAVLAKDRDVIISAATASGKTEAAFLPAFSAIRPGAGSTSILYISPLKALINDQRRRLSSLAQSLRLPVTAWHGDMSREDRSAYFADPRGVLMTTPESLEGFLLRHTSLCYTIFADLEYVIIDEFHSLADSERGFQLLSLLRRLEVMLRRTVPRIALSATFGSADEMVERLRPHRNGYPCTVVSTQDECRARFEVRTYVDVPPYMRKYVQEKGLEYLIRDLYQLLCRGHNLIFTNSRRRTEQIAAALAKLCREEGRENEFFPHHGSLSQSLRQSLEQRLQSEKPATAVCTMTLELGIDIGNMDSIAQLDAPGSVASMRQRLGRTGRRGETPLLRLFLLEGRITAQAAIQDKLRMGLFQALAVLRLIREGWNEPVGSERPHYSTLAQQVMSVVSQYNGVRPSALYGLLCTTGPFAVTQNDFMVFLKGLHQRNLVLRDENKEIRLTEKGQQIVSGLDFLTAFRQAPEYTLVNNGSILGRLPMDEPLEEGQRILFAGRAWRVTGTDLASMTIQLARDTDGEAPKFGGFGKSVHDRVRQVMRELYVSGTVPDVYCSYMARNMMKEGRRTFLNLELGSTPVLLSSSTLYLFPWRGDTFCRTVVALLRMAGMNADTMAGVVDVRDASLHSFRNMLSGFLAKGKPDALKMTRSIDTMLQGKFASFVDESLLARDNALRFYAMDEAWDWLVQLVDSGLSPQKVNFF